MARPSSDTDLEARREEILAAAQNMLAQKGYKKTSMLDVAKKAGASKETLYSWFGDKAGLFAAAIERNAQNVRETIMETIEKEEKNKDPKFFLMAFSSALLRLITSEESLALNRAAISEAKQDMTLSQTLAKHGRQSIIPLLQTRLKTYQEKNILKPVDLAEAGEVLIGLTLTDLQVRMLLGFEIPLEEAEITKRAQRASEQFLILYGHEYHRV